MATRHFFGLTLIAPRDGSVAGASLEELMNTEVASASNKGQRLGSPAAFVIAAEDIRRSGWFFSSRDPATCARHPGHWHVRLMWRF